MRSRLPLEITGMSTKGSIKLAIKVSFQSITSILIRMLRMVKGSRIVSMKPFVIAV